MSPQLKVVADEVSSRAKGLRDYANRMERLRSSRNISETDLNRVYAGAFLSFHTFLERSLERAFLGLLMGRLVSSDSSVRPLVAINSNKVAHEIVRGGRTYVDWLPYDRHMVKRADAFFSGGRPFRNLSKAEMNVFARATVMRNAIAHESSHALRQFARFFTVGKSLPPDQRRPAGYLRGQHAVGQSRFDLMLSEGVVVMRSLCQ